MHVGQQQQPSSGPLFSSQGFQCLTADCCIGFGQYYEQRTKSSSLGYRAGHDRRSKSTVMFATSSAAVTTPHTSRQEAKYIAYTSIGWEHNRLHSGTTNDTVGITIVRLCSQSSTDGGGWHKAHPTAGVLLGAQHSSINTNPGSRRHTNKVWADSSNLSAHVRFGGTILSIFRLGLIN